jgi:hypothetical protein
MATIENVSDELSNFTGRLRDIDAGQFIAKMLFGNNENELRETQFNVAFLKDIKKKIEDSASRYGKDFEKYSKEQLKQMVDPFGLSDPKTAKDVKDKVATYKNKVNQFLDLTLPEEQKNKNDVLKAVLSSSQFTSEELEKIRNAPIDQPRSGDEPNSKFRKRTEYEQEGYDLLKEFQKTIGLGGTEQRGFDAAETTVGAFSRNAKRDLLEVLQLDKMFDKLSSDIADKMDKKNKDKEKEGSDYGSMLTKLLGGGVAAAFMGIVGFASALMSDGATKGFIELAGKTGLRLAFGPMLAKIATKFSLGFLKRLPIIGSLISFAYSYNDFMRGEFVDGSLQLLSGLVNLVPGVGVPLSLGIDVLQSIMDVKAGEGGTASEKNARKLNLLKDWGNNLYNKLKTVPFISNIISFGEGFTSLFTDGITSSNLDKMSELPLLGIFPAILKTIWEASSWKKGEMPTFNWDTFSNGFSKTIKKAILSWIPDIPGLRKYVANAMGVDLEGNSTDLGSVSSPIGEDMRNAYNQPLDEQYIKDTSENFKKELESRIQKYNTNISNVGDQSKRSDYLETEQYQLKNQADEAKKLLEDSNKLKMEAMNQEVAKKQKIQQEEYTKATSFINKPAQVINDWLGPAWWLPDYEDPLQSKKYKQTEEELLKARSQFSILKKQATPVNDITASGSVIITDSQGKSYKTDPSDTTISYKEGDLMDKRLKALYSVMSDVNNNISTLVKITPKENNNNYSNVNISGGQQSKGYAATNTILEHRLHHIRMHDSGRIC